MAYKRTRKETRKIRASLSITIDSKDSDEVFEAKAEGMFNQIYKKIREFFPQCDVASNWTEES